MGDSSNNDVGRRRVLKGVGIAGGAAALGGLGSATPGRDPGPKKEEILVGVTKGVDDLERSVAKHVPGNARVVHSNDRIGYVAVRFPSQVPERARENFVDAITKKDHVRYAEPNATVEALVTPDDPLYGYQYAPEMVHCEDAWETTLGDPEVTISVVDQGVQYDHPALSGALEDGRDFADDDGDPYPDDSNESHGTHVAGVAAGAPDDGTGHAGISGCSLLSARALDESGSGSLSDVADAITWSADRGADVINLSLGVSSPLSTLENAVSYADGQGSLVVAAAGNDGQRGVDYPAAYQECIAVSALDSDGGLASYSNYGDEIDLCAPGSRVVSSVSGDGYARYTGTSMATPVVSGVAGLALSVRDVKNDDLRLLLAETAEDVGLSTSEQGAGRVHADATVTAAEAGACGGQSTTASVSSSLSGDSDSDCWYYPWQLDATCQVAVELSGPEDATFDLYVTETDGECPSTTSYDYASTGWGSDERVVVERPDTSAPLYVRVDSYSGSGGYDLSVTEKGN